MKLLIDAHLSPWLFARLNDIFPDSQHVQSFGLSDSDLLIWEHAVAQDSIVLTKDDDFEAIALLNAPPGKVILVRLGNCSTLRVESLLRRNHELISRFVSGNETILVLP